MNIHRYLIPTSVAAAVHVALFLALPKETWVRSGGVIFEIPLPPWPKPPEPPVPADPEGEKSTEPVKPLGGPTPPEPPEPEVSPRPEGILIPIPDKPVYSKAHTNIIPKLPGPGDQDGITPWPAGDAEDIFNIGKLDRVPRAKVQLPPEYPPALSRDGVNGSATVEFYANTTGQVVRAEVVSCTHREFGEAAVRAVRKWQFEPGRRNGKAVPFRMTQTIDFAIKSD